MLKVCSKSSHSISKPAVEQRQTNFSSEENPQLWHRREKPLPQPALPALMPQMMAYQDLSKMATVAELVHGEGDGPFGLLCGGHDNN